MDVKSILRVVLSDRKFDETLLENLHSKVRLLLEEWEERPRESPHTDSVFAQLLSGRTSTYPDNYRSIAVPSAVALLTRKFEDPYNDISIQAKSVTERLTICSKIRITLVSTSQKRLLPKTLTTHI
jgi:hypothetical protein